MERKEEETYWQSAAGPVIKKIPRTICSLVLFLNYIPFLNTNSNPSEKADFHNVVGSLRSVRSIRL